MANTVTPVAVATERWMRMPGVVGQAGALGDLFVFSGYADFTGGLEPIQGVGGDNTDLQESWVDYSITQMRVGPRWLRVHGICPTVVIGGHNQVSPDHAQAMGYRVQGITAVDVVETSPGIRRIQLGVNVTVRGGTDGQILTLAYQVTAFGTLASPMGPGGVFFTGASDPT